MSPPDQELLDMLIEAQSPGVDGGQSKPYPQLSQTSTSIGAKPIQKCSYTHEALIDLIIAHPFWNQDDIARHAGYTPSWLSNIIHSDAFQVMLAKRKDEIIDPILRQTIEDQFKGMVARSLEIIRHHLNKPAPDVPVTVAMKALEISSRAAGYGAKVDPRPETNVHIHLESMADRLSVLLHKKRSETIDGDFDAQT